MKTCSIGGCGKPHRARGLCSTHYNRANDTTKVVVLPCASCGLPVAKTSRRNRSRHRVTCSDVCRAILQFGAVTCSVPPEHPSRAPLSCPVPSTHPCRRQPDKDCEWCGQAAGRSPYCSMTCRQRAKAMRRKARESDGRTYSWSNVIRVLAILNGCCAYCNQRIDGPPDPDHVIPTQPRREQRQRQHPAVMPGLQQRQARPAAS